MLLPRQDGELFAKLDRALHTFVCQRLKTTPAALDTPEKVQEFRKAFLEHSELIDAFVEENPADLTAAELDIVHAWRHRVAGKFYVFRELSKYTVFLSSSDPAVAYGVIGLSRSFAEMLPQLPVLVETVLLPFKDKLIYDGLLNTFRISFGPGVRRSLNERFKEAKVRHGIVTSLPISAQPTAPAAKPPKAKRSPKPKANPKDATSESVKIILSMVDQFCKDHLNAEYADLCRELTEKLARKRPSPLVSGKPNTWASGIIRTIGWVNFLDDRKQKPHLKFPVIDKALGVAESTGQGKSKLIRKMLKIRDLDPEWTLPSKLEDNPRIWMLSINGFIVDVRHESRELQEAAFKKGLIPYIPADRKLGPAH